MNPENEKGLEPGVDLFDLMVRARSTRLEELRQELKGRDRTDPRYDASQRPTAPTPPGVSFVVGRPPGAALNPSDAGQGRDKFGNPIFQPNIADLRDHLPGGGE